MKKECIEGQNKTDCKKFRTGDDRDKCNECHENYKLSGGQKESFPEFIKCGETILYNCDKCDMIIDYSKDNPFQFKCGVCIKDYILKNGVCASNVDDYILVTSGQNIKFNFFSIIYLILLLYLK